MAIVQRLERLTRVLDFATQTPVYTFLDGQGLDQSWSAATGTIAVPGSRYGYDPLGDAAAMLTVPRHTSWRVYHVWAPGETWSSLKRDMMLAFGHLRRVILEKEMPDGTLVTAEARLVEFPDAPDPEGQFRISFTLVFEQREDWKGSLATNIRYDSGLLYDSGYHYDPQGQSYDLNRTGVDTLFNLTNGGDVNEWDVFLQFNGPIVAPFGMNNFSCDVRGIPCVPRSNPPQGTIGFTVNASLAANQWLSIDGRTGVVDSNATGFVPWAAVVKHPGQHGYFALVPGVNECLVSQNAAGGTGSIYIGIHDRYR